MILGFATMNPALVVQMLDKSKYDVAIWAGSPKTAEAYAVTAAAPPDGRKRVQLIMGVGELRKLARKSFGSTLIFDVAPNLERLREHVPELQIVDLKKTSVGHYAPLPVSPRQLTKLLAKDAFLPKALPSFCGDKIFSTAKAVMETTSWLTNTTVPKSDTGAQALMLELMEATTREAWVNGTDSYYAQYLFHLCNRSFMTSAVTRKLPNLRAKGIWKRLLEYADSDVGYAMYSAFYKLCRTKDKKATFDSVMVEFGLEPYAADFQWATSVVHPSPGYEFLVDLGSKERERTEPAGKPTKKPVKDKGAKKIKAKKKK